MIYECKRRQRLDVSADVAWQWISDVRRLLRLNMFHAEVNASHPVMHGHQSEERGDARLSGR